MQTHVIVRPHSEFIVVSGGCADIADNFAGDIYIAAGQYHHGTGFQPAVGSHIERALGRADLQQVQARVVLANGGVNRHIIKASQNNATPNTLTFENTAIGTQTDFTRKFTGSGIDDDVTLGSDVAFQQQRVARIDHDVGTGTTRHKSTGKHSVPSGVKYHAA